MPQRHRLVNLLLALAFLGCWSYSYAAARSFRMGFTPFSHDTTREAVQDMRAFLADNADIIAIHLEGVPWAEALSGRPFHPNMMQDWKDKSAAIPANAQVYLAITPLDGGRRTLAAYRGAAEGQPLPTEFRNKTLDDPLVRKAYLAYCTRAIDYFKPAYLCIGIETNELFHNAKPSWPAYVALHKHIYAEIKKLHPDLPVFASFTVHNMLNPGWSDRQAMLKAFKDLMDYNDIVALSIYPFMAGLSNQVDSALGWLTREFGQYSKPYAVAEMGQLAEKLTLPSLQWTIDGNPALQADFYEKMLSFARTHRTAFMISFLYRDYDALWEKIKSTAPEAFMAWRDCGLLDEQARQRPAYHVWRKHFQIPLSASANPTGASENAQRPQDGKQSAE